MGRWGISELVTPGAGVVGLMTHLATADCDEAFARQQVARFRVATEQYAYLTRHAANSAAALRIPEARFDAARCGVAIYGLSPFNTDPADDGLEPALRWESYLAQVKLLRPGESTGYGRRFVAERTRGSASSRSATRTGSAATSPARKFASPASGAASSGTVSMDAFAVELDRGLPVGTPVTILGHGMLAEEHARVAGTINYELSEPHRERACTGPAHGHVRPRALLRLRLR